MRTGCSGALRLEVQHRAARSGGSARPLAVNDVIRPEKPSPEPRSENARRSLSQKYIAMLFSRWKRLLSSGAAVDDSSTRRFRDEVEALQPALKRGEGEREELRGQVDELNRAREEAPYARSLPLDRGPAQSLDGRRREDLALSERGHGSHHGRRINIDGQY